MPRPKEVEATTAVPDFEIEAIARSLFPTLQAFYASPEGKAAFEAWQREQANKL